MTAAADIAAARQRALARAQKEGMAPPLIAGEILWNPDSEPEPFGNWIESYCWEERCDGRSIEWELNVLVFTPFGELFQRTAYNGSVIHRVLLWAPDTELSLANLVVRGVAAQVISGAMHGFSCRLRVVANKDGYPHCRTVVDVQP